MTVKRCQYHLQTAKISNWSTQSSRQKQFTHRHAEKNDAPLQVAFVCCMTPVVPVLGRHFVTFAGGHFLQSTSMGIGGPDLLQGSQYLLTIIRWSLTPTHSSHTLLVNFKPRVTGVRGSAWQAVGSDPYLMTCLGRCKEMLECWDILLKIMHHKVLGTHFSHPQRRLYHHRQSCVCTYTHARSCILMHTH